MRGLEICIGALYLRGIGMPTVDQILEEADRIRSLKYLKGEDREEKKALEVHFSTTPDEARARFLATEFDEGFGWCARFKEGDLVENSNDSWRYGVVKGIVTEYNSGVEPNCFCLKVSIKNSGTDTVFWRRLKDGAVKLANLPPEILELAISQVSAKCPLFGEV